jgi:hypothetical protein
MKVMYLHVSDGGEGLHYSLYKSNFILKVQVFWSVMQCQLLNTNRLFEGK